MNRSARLHLAPDTFGVCVPGLCTALFLTPSHHRIHSAVGVSRPLVVAFMLSRFPVVDAFPLSAARVREQGGRYRSSVFPRHHQPAVQQLG